MKLSSLTIYLIGFFMALAIFSYGLCQHYLPNKQETQMNQDVLVQLQAETNKQGAADKRKDDAVAKVIAADKSWASMIRPRSIKPSLQQGGIDLTVNRWQLSVDVRKFRNSVQRQVNRQLRTGGVEVLAGPYIPSPGVDEPVNTLLSSTFNTPPYSFPVVIYDLGQVQVRGTYAQILAHVRSWARMPNFLAVADGLALSGTSPNLIGTYNLQVVGFIQKKGISAPVPEVAGGAAGGGAGGFGGFGGGAPAGFGGGGPGGSLGRGGGSGMAGPGGSGGVMAPPGPSMGAGR
jgi:hypothetical protein